MPILNIPKVVPNIPQLAPITDDITPGKFKPVWVRISDSWLRWLIPLVDAINSLYASFSYGYVNIINYGARNQTGFDNTAAIQAAIDTGRAVYVPAGEWETSTVTMSEAGQVMFGDGSGASLLIRNANGTIVVMANRGQQLRHLSVRGESSTPSFTGHNISIQGASVEDCVLLDVDSRWCLGGASNLALSAQDSPGGLLIDGGSYSHQGSAGDEVVILGNTGLTAGVNYVTITNMVTHKANQPWTFYACAGMTIQGCQIGGWNWLVSTTSGIVTVNKATGNRIIGNVNVLGSGHCLIGNALAPTYTLTFDTHATDGANGCVWLGTEANTANIVTVGVDDLILRHLHGGTKALGLGPTASLAAIDFDTASGDLYPSSAIRLINNKNLKQLSSAAAELRMAGYNASDNFFVGQSTTGDFTSLVGVNHVYTQVGANTRLDAQDTVLRPHADDQQNLGGAGNRWKEVFAVNGTIDTSDAREKRDIGVIPDVVLDAWAEVEFVQFRWIAAVNEKGDGARIHVGVLAQQILEVFTRHDLEPFGYALLCYDSWDEHEVIDGHDEVVVEGETVSVPRIRIVPAGDRFGVRMDQCMVLEAALNRRELARIKVAIGG